MLLPFEMGAVLEKKQTNKKKKVVTSRILYYITDMA